MPLACFGRDKIHQMNGMVYRLFAKSDGDSHTRMRLIRSRLQQMRKERVGAIEQNISQYIRRLQRPNIIVAAGRKVQDRVGLQDAFA